MIDRSNRRGERPAFPKENESAISFAAVNWRRLLGYLSPYKGHMTLAILALLFQAVLAWPFRS